MKAIEYKHKNFVPYRICPLGAHVDHQLGVITGFALDKGITINYNITDDGSFKIKSHDFAGEIVFDYENLPKKSDSWYDYLIGSIIVLKSNYDLNKGFDGYVNEALPVGGLASSSAIIINYLQILAKINGIVLEEKDLVSLVVRVEKEYMNTKIGVLDPSCEIYSKKDSLLYLDTKDGTYKLIKAKEKIDFKVCLIYSGVSRKLRNTLYNVRVDECKMTAFFLNSILQNVPIEFKDAYLRNFSYDDFNKNKKHLPINHIKRATHFYSEMDRIKKGVEYFENGDLINFGKLIFESGTSSIENYETGSEQLESLHNIVKNAPGVYGGRFSGAGFNGFYMALVDPKKVKEVEDFVSEKYLSLYPQYKNEFKIYMCEIADGVNL